MSDADTTPNKRRRQSRACARCRKRKIRCDFQYPTCGACLAADAACLGYDAVEGTDQPRSVVHHLEEQVARLEFELAELKRQTETPQDRFNDAIEKLSVRLATTTVEPTGPVSKIEQLLPLVDYFFLSDSPLPPFFDYDRQNPTNVESQSQSRRMIKISSISRHVVDAMLQHYCKTYRPQYPSIDEADLYRARDHLYANVDCTGYDAFVIYMTLAISSNTLAYSDEERAAATTRNLWTTAVAHLEQVGTTSSWERLQALQLLVHYGFLNPQHVNVSHCAAAASRLALHLGLHQELPMVDQIRLGPTTLDTRRRMFWNAYGMDAAVHSARHQPFKWSRSEINAKLPDNESQTIPTQSAHMWSLREIECDLVLGLYYPLLDHTDPGSPSEFEPWRAKMQKRLELWHHAVRQSVSLSEKIEFAELLFQIQVLKLHRPSPRCVKPSRDMCMTALKASITLIKEFTIHDQLGKMFMLWHAANCTVEAGVYLLSSVLKGLEFNSPDRKHMDGEDVSILAKYINAFSKLISKISRRWSSMSSYTSALTTIATSASDFLQKWSLGQNLPSSEYKPFQAQLDAMGTLSATATPTQAVVNIQAQSELNQLLITSSEPRNYSYANTDFTDLPVTSNETMPHSFMAEQPNLDPNLTFFSGSDAIDFDPATWDFPGVASDEIFAAMLNDPLPDLDVSLIYRSQV